MNAMHSVRDTDNPDELFDLVDSNDKVIGQVRRGDAHGNPSLIHRSVQILIFDDTGRVLLQLRSRGKDLYPGVYCASASGHVACGDDYTTTAERELREELGISAPLHFIERQIITSPYETEMTALYAAHGNGPFDFHPHEVAGGRFFTLAEIAGLRARGGLVLTPSLEAALATVDRLAQNGELAVLLATL
jgi:isopentenyldiphosphate isomerase